MGCGDGVRRRAEEPKARQPLGTAPSFTSSMADPCELFAAIELALESLGIVDHVSLREDVVGGRDTAGRSMGALACHHLLDVLRWLEAEDPLNQGTHPAERAALVEGVVHKARARLVLSGGLGGGRRPDPRARAVEQ